VKPTHVIISWNNRTFHKVFDSTVSFQDIVSAKEKGGGDLTFGNNNVIKCPSSYEGISEMPYF